MQTSFSKFPASPPWFIQISTPSKTRVFRLDHDLSDALRPTLVQVATVSEGLHVGGQLIDALNEAAWTGSRIALDRALSNLPAPVAQACLQALEECPDPETIPVEFGYPLSVVRRSTFSQFSHDLAHEAKAAMNVGLQFLISNKVGVSGEIEFDALLMSGDCEVSSGQQIDWWPNPSEASVLSRLHPAPNSLEESFKDPRWETHVGHAYWVWVKDSDDPDEYTSTTEWVVEFLDVPLDPDRNFRVFVAEDNSDDESRGFLTVRTRFLLWMALWNMSADLDGLVVDWGDYDSIVRGDMPVAIQGQKREWWRQLHRSCDRLCEAARRGLLHELVPRTVAEEALISLATRSDYVDWARDSVDLHGLHNTLEALPVSEADEVWEEVLGGLTGDVDVEIFWNPVYMNRADPADPVNQSMGIGDYRPAAWHRLFDRAVPPLLERDNDG